MAEWTEKFGSPPLMKRGKEITFTVEDNDIVRQTKEHLERSSSCIVEKYYENPLITGSIVEARCQVDDEPSWNFIDKLSREVIEKGAKSGFRYYETDIRRSGHNLKIAHEIGGISPRDFFESVKKCAKGDIHACEVAGMNPERAKLGV